MLTYLSVLSSKVSQILFALIWPFMAFVLWIKDFRNQKSGVIFGLFILYSCVTQAVITKSSDIVKQRVYYERFLEADLSFIDFMNLLYSTETYVRFKNFDIVESGLWFILSIFNASTFWLDFGMGLLFALVFTYNLKHVMPYVKRLEIKQGYLCLLFFLFIAPFWLITGFRFHFATLLAFTAYVQFYLVGKKRRGLFFLALAPFSHFGYWFILPLPFLFHLLRRFKWVALIFAITLNFMSNTGLFKIVLNAGKAYVPQELFSQGEDYVSDEKIEKSAKNSNKGKSLHAAYYQEAAHLFIFFAAVALFFHLNYKIPPSGHLTHLSQNLNIVLFLSGTTGLLDTIPGAKRFEVLEQMMFFIVMLQFFVFTKDSNRKRQFPTIIKLVSPLAFFWLIVEFRKVFDSFSVATLLGNPLTAFFLNDVALIELIKW
jgi:hypothetical protein